MPKLKWLDEPPKNQTNVTWGIPWEKGQLKKTDKLALINNENDEMYVQSWPLAYWPDGSVKWSAQSSVFDSNSSMNYEIRKTNKELSPSVSIKVYEDENYIIVDTNKILCKISKSGTNIIEETLMDGKVVNKQGKLVVINETRNENMKIYNEYYSKIEKAEVENSGPLRVTIKISGVHKNEEREWLPFVVRITFGAGLASFKITHTLFFEEHSQNEFIKGIGIQFKMNLQGSDFNKHIRYALEEGIYSEPAKLLLTRFHHINNIDYEKQISGKLVNLKEADKDTIESAEKNTIWNDFKLMQDSANHYKIIKRSENDLASIEVTHGNRANGLMYVCGENCGLSLSLKSFWQRYPSSLEVKGLAKDETKLTLWLWDPSSEAMDLRHYSKKPHMVAYEGFEEIRSTPVGIANTSDIYINCYKEMESNEELNNIAKEYQNNSLLVCEPEYYYKTQTTGKWGLPDRRNNMKKFFEDRLDENFNFYKNEIDQRSWYGYWNYGDIMHTYDGIRHQWRYDLGGYAWQNTELVPNIWLWYQFFRTGNKDVFKMVESMTRHNSEVDIYHFGQYKGLGSRHNVIHWGCSCKEARISMAILYKYYYYLTADERIGEILSEVKDADKSVDNLEPLRGFYPDSKVKNHIRIGPDWSAYCSNWQTEWERNNDIEYENKIKKGLTMIKRLPMKLLSTPACEYNTKTSELKHIGDTKGEYHMMISFGAPQIWIELAELLEDEEFKDMIAEFGEFYMLSDEEKKARTQGKLSNKVFHWPMFATGIAAYAANRNCDKNIAINCWKLLIDELNKETKKMISLRNDCTWKNLIDDENVTTNCVSQWSINTIMCLELIGDMMPISIK